jgi:acyl-CoA hydrolase
MRSGFDPQRIAGRDGNIVKTITTQALARVLTAIPGTPRVVASGNFATPRTILKLIDSTVAEFNLFMLNAQAGIPDREGVRYETAFIGDGMRDSPRLIYYPCRLSRIPNLIARRLPPDVVVLHTSRPIDGAVSLGIETNILPAAIEAARARGGIIIAQANRNMPVTYGDAMIPLDDVDYLIDVDEPLVAHPTGPPDEVSAQIGENVAALCPGGASLQLGIGAIPDAVSRALLDGRGFRIWSELVSDGVFALEKAGCLDQDTPIVASIIFGSAELYDWVSHNSRIRMLRTEKTNDPGAIARRGKVFSVNGALQVDLFGQANATRAGKRLYSGFGGQSDFVVGALHSPGGTAVIALRSWHAKSGSSAIVPLLPTACTSFQHSYIVTENGAAEVSGADALTQAQNILDRAAHPDARNQLCEGGRELGLALR